MRVARWTGRMLALSIWALPLCARAQAPSATAAAGASGDAVTARARDLYTEGAKLFNEGKYEAARVSFAAAYAIKPHPENARALADCEWALQKWRDAAEHFAAFFANKPQGADEAKVKLAQQRFDEARAKVGTVRVKVTPRSAVVSINGHVTKAEELPAELFVEPGELTIEASAADLEAVKKTMKVKAGEAVDVPIELKARQAASLPATVTPWRPPLALVLGSGAVVLVGIGAGIGLTAAAGDQAGKAQQLALPGGPAVCRAPSPTNEQACMKLKDAWATQDTLSNAAVGSFVAGGVFAVAATSFLVWRGAAPEQRTVQVSPVVSSQGGVMMVSGKW